MADTPEAPPWKLYVSSAPHDLEAQAHLVLSRFCPTCGGTGLTRAALLAQDVEKALAKSWVCWACHDRGWLHSDVYGGLRAGVRECPYCGKLENSLAAKVVHDLMCDCCKDSDERR